MLASGSVGAAWERHTYVAKNRSGFTLIELLIVVVIIGILAAIAIPSFAFTKEKAYDATAVADLRGIITASEAYFADNLTYPTDMTAVDFTLSPKVTITQFTLGTKNGIQSLHIHIGHDNSSHYYHAHYPAESGFEKRKK